MLKKSLFLSVLTIGLVIPSTMLNAIWGNPTPRCGNTAPLIGPWPSHGAVYGNRPPRATQGFHEFSNPIGDMLGFVAKAAIVTTVAAAGVYGVYKLGEWCDLWGGPDPKAIVDAAITDYKQTRIYQNYIAPVQVMDEQYLLAAAQEKLDIWTIRSAAHKLTRHADKLSDCLSYVRKSVRYTPHYRIYVCDWHTKVRQRADDLNVLADWLESHRNYFSLYNAENGYATKYAHERALYENYIAQPDVLKAELYATAGNKYQHAWSIVDYAQQLNADITHFAKVIDTCSCNNGVAYERAQSACQLYKILQDIHTLIINDRVFVDTAEQYIGWQEQKKAAQRERECIEYERKQAERERARLEAARIAAERERQLACNVHAGYQYANGYYNGKADADLQKREAQRREEQAREDARRSEHERRLEAQRADAAREEARRQQQQADYQRTVADRERAEKERLEREKKEAEERRRREQQQREEQQRQERKRQEAEAEKQRIAQQQEAARLEAERQRKAQLRAAEREAREQQEAEDRRRREREEEVRKERKRKEIEAEKEAARREAERKAEEARYNAYDRFQ